MEDRAIPSRHFEIRSAWRRGGAVNSGQLHRTVHKSPFSWEMIGHARKRRCHIKKHTCPYVHVGTHAETLTRTQIYTRGNERTKVNTYAINFPLCCERSLKNELCHFERVFLFGNRTPPRSIQIDNSNVSRLSRDIRTNELVERIVNKLKRKGKDTGRGHARFFVSSLEPIDNKFRRTDAGFVPFSFKRLSDEPLTRFIGETINKIIARILIVAYIVSPYVGQRSSIFGCCTQLSDRISSTTTVNSRSNI